VHLRLGAAESSSLFAQTPEGTLGAFLLLGQGATAAVDSLTDLELGVAPGLNLGVRLGARLLAKILNVGCI
jgi:hypothetical protein